MPTRLLITGVTGLLGSRVATLAMEKGCAVRTLARAEWDGAPYVPVADRRLGDLPMALPAGLCDGMDAVIHCAATAVEQERMARAINVDGPRRLAEMARAARVKVFVHVSSSSAAPDALSIYGRTKHAGEEAVRAVTELPSVIVRPNLIVGPGGRGVWGRMAGMVAKLPVLPLLGGGHGMLQPIHVDDLAAALLTCVERADTLAGSTLNLGDPAGIALRDLLQEIAVASRGLRKFALTIPLWPIELVVGLAESLGIKLPIGSANLKGMRKLRLVETGPDMAQVGLKPRPVAEIVRLGLGGGEGGETAPTGPGMRPTGVLLVGGGRIGLVHALTLGRLPGAVLAGVVDPNPKARALLTGLGLRAPGYSSLDAGLAGSGATVAIVATPPATHLKLATTVLNRGLAVLVEKPLSPGEADLAAWDALAQGPAEPRVITGYIVPRAPHIAAWAARIRRGEFGRVTGFSAVSLLSFVTRPGQKGWQFDPAAAGGGVLMNPGVHALSMIHAAFGPPRSVKAASRRIHSARVEDSLAATFAYEGFTGTLHASWAIEGFARPDHALTVTTDRGVVRMTGAAAVFTPTAGAPESAHQIDTPAPFNLAPDFAGAGFALELAELRDAPGSPERRARTGFSLAETVAFERTIHAIYASAAQGAPLAGHPAFSAPPATAIAPAPNSTVVLDLRDWPAAEAGAFAASTEASRWGGLEVTTDQVRREPGRLTGSPEGRVTVPDFLDHSRLLLGGQAGAVLGRIGAVGTAAAVRAALAPALRDRGASFWAAASGLLAADLAAIPPGFAGTLLLHPALCDLAITLRRTGELGGWLTRLRARCPRARVGFHTQLAADAPQAVALLPEPPDAVSVLGSPDAVTGPDLAARIRDAAAPHPVLITIEVGPAPTALHRIAAGDPARWTHGAGQVLVHGSVVPPLAADLREALEPRWATAFPGVPAPDLWG